MKKNLPVIAICGIMLIGLCVFLYPIVSGLLARMTQSSTIAQYRYAVDHLSEDKVKQMKAEAEKYNQSLSGTTLSDPFNDKEQGKKSPIEMISIDDTFGYIEIPKINVYLPLYYGTAEETLTKGVGILENTSLPIGGEGTHSVLSGHRGLPSATLFTDLDQLQEGDVFYIHVLDEVLVYQVDQIKVVDPEVTSDLTIVPGKDYVTLLTCTPYGINTQRLLIRGTRIENTIQFKPKQIELLLSNEVTVVPTFVMLMIAFCVVIFIRRKR